MNNSPWPCFQFSLLLLFMALFGCDEKKEKENDQDFIKVSKVISSDYSSYKKVHDNKTCLKWYIHKKAPAEQKKKIHAFTERFKMFFKMKELGSIEGNSSCSKKIIGVCKMKFSKKDFQKGAWPKGFRPFYLLAIFDSRFSFKKNFLKKNCSRGNMTFIGN